MSTPPPLTEVLSGLFSPWLFLAISLSYLPGAILRDPFSPGRLQASWFSAFWAKMGPNVRTNAEARVLPLLRGRWRGGRVVGDEDDGGAAVSGTVVEIGPGSGMWVSIFSDRYLQPSSGGGEEDAKPGVRRRGAATASVTKVFGVEPNAEMHDALGKKIREAGLEGVYEIVPVGIEDLASSGRVQPESVDCIVSVLCLCGIPEPERNIKELYGYLKPGGRWYVYEHVKCDPKQGWAMGLYQGMFKPPTLACTGMFASRVGGNESNLECQRL